MEWRWMMGGALAAIVVGGVFYFVWTGAGNDKEARAVEEAEYAAKAKAESDAAARLLSDPAATKAVIEKRLNAWIKAKDDVIFLEENTSDGRQLVRTIPSNRAWSVTCLGGVLAVEFPALSADEDALKQRLLPGKLDAQQCRGYVAFAASKMIALTRQR